MDWKNHCGSLKESSKLLYSNFHQPLKELLLVAQSASHLMAKIQKLKSPSLA